MLALGNVQLRGSPLSHRFNGFSAHVAIKPYAALKRLEAWMYPLRAGGSVVVNDGTARSLTHMKQNPMIEKLLGRKSVPTEICRVQGPLPHEIPRPKLCFYTNNLPVITTP